MYSQTRRVRKLRIRSVSDSLNRRGAIMVENALRTASLREADSSRLIVVRSLALGSVRVNEPIATIASRIERRWNEVIRVAVDANSPSAASAKTVYFRDRMEANTALALRLAQNQDVSAWFWRLAVPGFSPSLARDEALRATLVGALDSVAGSIVGGLTFMQTLLRRGAIEPMLGALRYQDGSVLLQAFGWKPANIPLDKTPVRFGSTLAPPQTLMSIGQRWFTAWDLDDPRTVWLSRVFLCLDRPSLTEQADLASAAAQWVQTLVGDPGASVATGLATAHPAGITSLGQGKRIRFDEVSSKSLVDSGTVIDVPARTNPGLTEQNRSRIEQQQAKPIHRVDLPSPGSIEIREDPVRSELDTAEESARLPPAELTQFAGIFFLVPIMERLGIANWLSGEPAVVDWNLPGLILKTVARRLATSDFDPILAAIGELPEEPPEAILASVRDWVLRIRRYARLTARIGLRSLICRPGKIICTETHIDVYFRLETADMRVRRAGLDIDPGWTPWLGRAVNFHYLEGESYDA